MSRFLNLFGLASLGLLLAGVIVGCGAQQGAGTSSPGGDADKSSAGSAQEAIPAGLKALTEADRAAALKQKICPVSDEALGEMGKPPKITVEGREVFLCCTACEKKLRSDPKKYFAKLDAPQP